MGSIFEKWVIITCINKITVPNSLAECMELLSLWSTYTCKNQIKNLGRPRAELLGNPDAAGWGDPTLNKHLLKVFTQTIKNLNGLAHCFSNFSMFQYHLQSSEKHKSRPWSQGF